MKAIRKIVSLGFGVLMVGATITGALAADLSNYPSMFIKDGQFDGTLVVGADAKAEDVIGITNIATSLQSVAVTETVVQTGESSSVTEGYELCNHNLYVGESISDCEPSVDEGDLDILADAVYHDTEGDNDNDEKYTQQLLFGDDMTGNFLFTQDDNDAEYADYYLFIDNSQHNLYNYTLQFDSGVDVSDDSSSDLRNDLIGTSLDIQGSTYVITDAKLSSGQISQIEMQSGESTIWMSEGESITRTIDGVEHDIELVDVDADASSNGGSCGFQIDGTTVWIDVKDTETINGVSVGVTDAKRVNVQSQNQDVCEVAVGARKLTLVDGDEIKFNNEKIDGTEVDITQKTSGGNLIWTGFEIGFAPENDEIYMLQGDEYIDPMFGNFKFVFAGIETGGVEYITFDAGSSDIAVSFNNEDGTNVELPLAASQDAQSGEDDDEPVYYGEKTPSTSDANQDKLLYLSGEVCSGSGSVVDCQGAMFLVVEPTKKEAHIVEITKIDLNDNEISFDDLTYGTTDDDVSYTDGSVSDMSLKSAGDVEILINESAGTITFTDIGSDDGAMIKTENRAELEIVNTDLTNQEFEGLNFYEFNDGSLDDSDYVGDGGNDPMEVRIVYDDVVQNHAVISSDSVDALTSSVGYGFYDVSKSNSDDKMFSTKKGSLITFDTDENELLVIEHPYDAAYARVYVSPTEAGVDDGNIVTTTMNPISVSAVKLDSEIEDVKDQNIVAVGGACANSVVAELMGNPSRCDTAMGLESGQALIKLYENGDYVALVVAGQDASDTRLASEILSNWQDYELTGQEMIATTVSASSLEVEEN